MSDTPGDEHALYLGDPVGPYFAVVVGVFASWPSLPDDIDYEDEEEDTTHDGGCGYLNGMPGVLLPIVIVTSLDRNQILWIEIASIWKKTYGKPLRYDEQVHRCKIKTTYVRFDGCGHHRVYGGTRRRANGELTVS